MTITPGQQEEIKAARSGVSRTLRPTVQAVEDILFHIRPVLDHGFVRVIDYMGDDAAVIQAARVSYGRGTKKVSEDRGLIRYLMRHSHSTPFEMAEIKLHVKLPIFVARQWVRHRTASLNEYSARYSILDREFYIPETAQIAEQSKINRQGRGNALNEEQAAQIIALLKEDAERNYNSYAWMINEDERGEMIEQNRSSLSRELARINLTLNTYTQWYWKVNLHNLLHFLRLRADPHAQHEIRVYADEILKIVASWVPLTHEAFLDFRLNSVTVSGQAVNVLQAFMSGNHVSREESGLSAREWEELVSRFPALNNLSNP
ncbi:FAD-dependent thymidylate synthase [Rhizobium sp. RMa-01]|uniref:FAD-dependent thymidylate synthase n=1 Tax=unclassified Rhizobium TaxID=2613769 RepID=UPI0008D9B671|nr:MULTISPECIES: FAD-dependent thymidylate synthase [unclassified Rhizobium]OHV22614.1 FAD-dependent thymidylate synthase [Rhizobium sp. RSm-3]RVU05237.1 FAD-dependent thymidylate synthase [Rhizobium sp. RMa-01]